MALIPPFFLDCVVSIGVPGQPEANWIGTGFIVGRPIVGGEGKKAYHTFLVTNKHVLEKHKEILIRFNTMHGENVIDYPVDLSPSGEQLWVGNPAQEIDIAVFTINHDALANDSAVYAFFALDEHSLGVGEMKSEGISEGDSLFVLGFPLGIVSDQSNCVVSRAGSIARIRDVLNAQQTTFLIDANIFPGNSGGPVVIRPEVSSIQGTPAINRASLIGIVKSYVPYRDVAISQHTGNPRVIFEENSGLALVETVDNIRNTVDLCFQLKVAPFL